MSKGLIDIILECFIDENWVGRQGEKLTERELNLVRLFGRSGKVLRNIYVPKDNGETTEIDVVFVTQKGIYVIESKNYSGWIFGDEKSLYWTAILPNNEKNKFYNPIKQNNNHVKWLGKYLGHKVPLFSIIAFSERCELKKIIIESPDIYVIKRDRLYAVVRKIWEESPDKLNEGDINDIYLRLKILTNVDEAIKKAHIENVKTKYKGTDNKSVIKSSEILSCPRCGGNLILRTAKKGGNAGNHFYGCANYPKCRYIQSI